MTEDRLLNESRLRNAIGVVILQLMKEKSISMARMAEISGIHYTSVQRMTYGKKVLRLSTILSVCCGMNLTLTEFFTRVEKEMHEDELLERQAKYRKEYGRKGF